MAALICAYQDESGTPAALLPLAGGCLLDHQARVAAAAGCAPVMLLVSRAAAIELAGATGETGALGQTIARLRREHINLVPVADGHQAASRLEPGQALLLIGEGVVADRDTLAMLAARSAPAVMVVPDAPGLERFERVDARCRWAGLARVDGALAGSTAAMLGEWDFQSTLLRRAIQAGVPLLAAPDTPVLADSAADLDTYEQALLARSRGTPADAAARWVTPAIEDAALRWLAPRSLPPLMLMAGAALTSLIAALLISRGWRGAGFALMLAALPLPRIAERLGALRLRPLEVGGLWRSLGWPLTGLAWLALGWVETRHGTGGWGPLAAALAGLAFAEADRRERGRLRPGALPFAFSPGNALLSGIPFALGGWWTAWLVGLALYAGTSFFIAQARRTRG